ncbi:MAG: dTDP-4-dehydrorhamnose reductase [Verrucomicrobiota bacterium]|nr:dTDP-4-dehydrorhamnose reductase [Verrucomicrobiota bacterium]
MADSPLRVAIAGAGGRLGAALVREYSKDFRVLAFNRAQLDLAAPEQMKRTLAAAEFDILINCAAQTNVDRCEMHREEAFAINAEAPRLLAEICAGKGARLIHISTDYVFDGAGRGPYREEDEARPISVYGESKLAGEQRVLTVSDRHLVARVSWVFGPDRPSFVDWVIAQAREKDAVSAVADKISTPTYTLDIAQMLQPFFNSETDGGIIHLANRGACSWQEYGQWALDCCTEIGLPLRARTVDPITLSDMKNFIAPRPVYTVLATDKFERLTGIAPRDWHEAVADYLRAHARLTANA